MGPRKARKPGAAFSGRRSGLSPPPDPDAPSPQSQRSPGLSRHALDGEGSGIARHSPLRELRGLHAGARADSVPSPTAPPPAMVALPSPLRGRADWTDDSTRSRRGGRTRAGLGLQPALGERGSKPPAPLWGVPVGWPRRSLKRGAGTPEALSAYSRGIWKPSELSRLFFGLPVSSAPDWVREDCT